MFAAADFVLVECDQLVKSVKRGVCVSEIPDADFMAFSPSVSWYYTWHYTETLTLPEDANLEFIPMVWGDCEADLNGPKDYLRHHRATYVCAINEWNLCGQAWVVLKTTARLFEDVQSFASRYNIPLIRPHMALGSSEQDSVEAHDPIKKKTFKYTFQNPFINAFWT